MPDVLFVQTAGETGLETLIGSGQLPPVPHFPGEASSWQDLLDMVAWLRDETHTYKALAIDCMDGAAQLCRAEVTRKHYENNPDKFLAYGRGFDVEPVAWKELLQSLDMLRSQRGMAVWLIGHAKAGKKKNPLGEDFTTYSPNMADKMWEVTKAWADAILFGNFYTQVTDGKARGGKLREIYTEHDASYDAGNRLGLPEVIKCGTSASEAWQNFNQALTNRKA